MANENTGSNESGAAITANDIVATSWTDLNDWLFADAWDADIGRFRSRFAYRG